MINFPYDKILVPPVEGKIMSIDTILLILAHLRTRNVLNKDEHYAVTVAAIALKNSNPEHDSFIFEDEEE